MEVAVTPEKLAHMREAATGCNGERWRHAGIDDDCHVLSLDGNCMVAATRSGYADDLLGVRASHARHIAEADPASVLALLDYVRDLEHDLRGATLRTEFAEQRLREMTYPEAQ